MIKRKLQFFLGGLAIGLAVGFARYFDHWVYFPAFPNIVDTLIMGIIGAYLIKQSIR